MHDRLATLGQRGPWGRPPPRAVAAPRLFRQAGRAEISVQIAARTAGEGARRLAEGDFASQDTGLQLVCLLLGTRLGQEENVPRLHVPCRHRLLLVAGQPVKQAHAHGEGANRGRPVGRGDRSAKRREQQRRAARGEHHRGRLSFPVSHPFVPGAARVCPPGTCTRISTRLGRGGGGRIEDGPGREGEGGRTGRHEGGGWSDAARERGRSVSATPIFFAALRAAVRVGRPDRIGNAADRDREALGQRRLETPLTLSLSGGGDQARAKRCRANMAHAAPV